MENKPSDLLVPLSSDECEHSGAEAEDSDEDIITDYHIPTSMEMLPRSGPLPPLPTISVTPHSPASKMYPVLEDSLQQVRDLHETVQHMRNASIINNSCGVKIMGGGVLNSLLAQMARLSTSCPALTDAAPEVIEALGGSLGSSPLHQSLSRKGVRGHDWLCQPSESQRRRSWTASEDLNSKDKMRHVPRQRSISLSSMESEADESSLIDTVDGSTVRLLGPDAPIIVRHRAGTRTAGGAVSTHSLNEADLQNDFNKIKAKREAEQLRLLPQRLPLQKSISTPSIIAAKELASESLLTGAQPTLPMGRPSGTESETEEEGSRGQHRYDPRSVLHMQFAHYDRHAEKRRKRGSLFFRKKKDKNKKNTHQWLAASYGCSQVCDICNKPLHNKPALYCESCGTTVHQNTCKDSILECSKPKHMKNPSKVPGFGAPLSSKSSLSKRGSASFSYNYSHVSNNHMGFDERDGSDLHHNHHDSINFPDDVPLVPLEFLADSQLSAIDLCSDLSLGLHEIEPDSWTPHVGKAIAQKFKEKEVKRQEHIYEFILTEKHHCITLLVMQKIFMDGLQKYFQLGPNLERMFPRLSDLIDLHLGLLSRLRLRQRENFAVSTVSDILLEEFSGSRADRLKSAYGEFCSKHRDAVEIYKYYLQNDSRFAQFVRHCQTNPLLKKKGIPECILFITQRLTKYPLLIEPLIKTSKENRQENEALQKSLALVKEILIEVDAQVAEKEKEDRKLDIYNRIDPKSFTVFGDRKFKKSDILQGNRSLKFEGVAVLMQRRKEVIVVVLSDVLFFLQESSNKYTFFTPDNKAGVISLQKLLVREIAGQDQRGIYLILPNLDDPEMFELKVIKPKDRQIWIHAIRDAVQNCPQDEDCIALSCDERQVLVNAKQHQIRQLVGLLRQKDIEQALLLEEKMALQLKLLSTAGLEPPSPPTYRHLVGENMDTGQMWKEVLTAVQEVSQLASSLYTTGTNLSRSVSSVGEHQSDTYVSPILPKRAETFGGFDNSTAQSGFKLLGKTKLQTSAGSGLTAQELETLKPGDCTQLFDRLPYRNCTVSSNINGDTAQNHLTVPPDGPALLTLGREQQYAAIQLSHYVYTLLCIISQLMTTNESQQVQLQSLKGNEGSKQYKHNQQLEELRNLQDKLSVEKAAWAVTKEQESKEMEEKRSELLRLQEQIRNEQNDITQQRDQLYRKMEILTSQGLLLSPNVALPMTGQLEDFTNKDTSEDSSSPSENNNAISSSNDKSHQQRKDAKWTKTATLTGNKAQLPINLISTTNQHKVATQVPVKQQIPLKLASRLSSGMCQSVPPPQPPPFAAQGQILPLKLVQDEKLRRTSMSGYQRLTSESFSSPSGETSPTIHSHSRTGSSPATIQISPPGSNTNLNQQIPNVNMQTTKATRTHTYPKLPDKFKQSQSAGNEEEVIYF